MICTNIKHIQKCSVQDITEDFTLNGAIERYLEVSLECVLDIGEMVISKGGFRKPETYKEIIVILGEEGILPDVFAERFAEAAKFRNILVHMYAEIDIEMLYEILQSNLDDFNEFARYIARYIEKADKGIDEPVQPLWWRNGRKRSGSD